MHAEIGFVSRRWAPEIILFLAEGPKRFNPMLHGIIGISDRVLTERLRDLITFGLVDRRVEVNSPIRVTYALTDIGRLCVAPLQALQEVAGISC